MSSTFLRELVKTMQESGENVALLDVGSRRGPVVIEFVRRPDSQLVHDQMRLLDASNEQQPHARN